MQRCTVRFWVRPSCLADSWNSPNCPYVWLSARMAVRLCVPCDTTEPQVKLPRTATVYDPSTVCTALRRSGLWILGSNWEQIAKIIKCVSECVCSDLQLYLLSMNLHFCLQIVRMSVSTSVPYSVGWQCVHKTCLALSRCPYYWLGKIADKEGWVPCRVHPSQPPHGIILRYP